MARITLLVKSILVSTNSKYRLYCCNSARNNLIRERSTEKSFSSKIQLFRYCQPAQPEKFIDQNNKIEKTPGK